MPMIWHLLQRGIKLWKQGNTEQARAIFKAVIHNERTNEKAWLWYIYSLETDKEKIAALEEFLSVAPENEKARLALEALRVEEKGKTAPLHAVHIEKREESSPAAGALLDPDSDQPEERKPHKRGTIRPM